VTNRKTTAVADISISNYACDAPPETEQSIMTHVTLLANNPERVIVARIVSELASERAFFGVSALLFAASAAVTVVWCASMSAMGEMPMPGGWTMSMAWMPMCGQTWPGAAASFLGMWVVMMAAMMLPSLVPKLWRYRQAVAGQARRAWLG
jgi:predicted metal-binding membrane protein